MKLGETYFVGVEEEDNLYEYNDYEYHDGPLYETKKRFEEHWKESVDFCKRNGFVCPKKPMLVKVRLILEEE